MVLKHYNMIAMMDKWKAPRNNCESAEKLAVHLITDIKTVKAAELKIKLCFNQVDPVFTKQESIVLRLRKTFLGEEIRCVKCRKNSENLNSKICKTKTGRMIMQSKRSVCVELKNHDLWKNKKQKYY